MYSKEIVKSVQKQYRFKLRGDARLFYHLGCDHFRENHGELLCVIGKESKLPKLCISLKFENIFGFKSSKYTSIS